jgi:hypothetical protein
VVEIWSVTARTRSVFLCSNRVISFLPIKETKSKDVLALFRAAGRALVARGIVAVSGRPLDLARLLANDRMDDPWSSPNAGWGNEDTSYIPSQSTSWSPKLESQDKEPEWPSEGLEAFPSYSEVSIPWSIQAEEEPEQEVAPSETERSQSPFQDDPLELHERPDTPEVAESKPASPIQEGQWGDLALPSVPLVDDKLPSWEPPSHAIEESSDEPVGSEEPATHDPWATARFEAKVSRGSGIYMASFARGRLPKADI